MQSIFKSRVGFLPSLITVAALAACGGGNESETAMAENEDSPVSFQENSSTDRATAQATTTTWSKIANEWSNFSVSGTRKVRFGSGSKWIEKSVTGNGRCDANFFGSDPALMVAKTCEVATVAETGSTPVSSTTPVSTSAWSKIASEWAYFTISGTKTVRYGSGSRWVQKTVTNSGMCTNSWFGSDPAPTIVKSCEVLNATTASTTPPATNTPTTAAPSTDGGSNASLVMRPFSSTSPWNTKIPANATYSNDGRVQSFRNVSDGYKLGVNVKSWTGWIWTAKASDPTVTVNVSVHNLDSQRGNPNPRAGNVTLKMPANAHPDPANYSGVSSNPWADDPDGKDGHMTVIDPEGQYAHEFWHMEKDRSTGQMKAAAYVRTPLNGTGVFLAGEAVSRLSGQYYTPSVTSYGWGPTRAYGGSALGGLIRQGEVTQTGINHALAMSIPKELLGYPAAGQLPLYPASKDDGRSMGYTGSILMGTRFAIPRSVNLSSLGLSPAGLRLATALQEYGAYIVDQSGGVRLGSDGVAAQAEGNALNAQPADLRKIHSLLSIVNP